MKLNKKIIAAIGACMLIAPSAALFSPNNTQIVQAVHWHPKKYVVFTKTSYTYNEIWRMKSKLKPGTVQYTGLLDWAGNGKFTDFAAYQTYYITKRNSKGFNTAKKARAYSHKHYPKFWYDLKHPNNKINYHNKKLWTLNGANNLVSPNDFKHSSKMFDPSNPDYNPDAPYEN